MPVGAKQEKPKPEAETIPADKWLCKTHQILISKGHICYECKEGRTWHETKDTSKKPY